MTQMLHRLLFFCVIYFEILMPSIVSQRTGLDNFIQPFRFLRLTGLNAIGRTANSQTSLRKAVQHGRLQRRISSRTPFPCSLDGMRSLKPPKSVHQLRPGDIDIVGALGDSLTAGNGIAASNILHVYTENRGLSWSIGGQGTWREYLTLPNILKIYNPNLFGYSLGDSLSYEKAAQFNCAEIAAMSRDMPFMAKELIRRMRNDPRVDLKQHWKMVTILIGANDFAIDICFTPDFKDAPKKHYKDMIKTLRILRDNLPRTFVNIVLAPSFDILLDFSGVPADCQFYHVMESPCFFGEQFKGYRNLFVNITKEWQDYDIKLGTLNEFNDRDDFAVVVQPFVKDLLFPKTSKGFTDLSYLSADCYHFSQKGDAAATNALWNNIMEPLGSKTINWEKEFKKIICPTKDSPYIYTTKNSGGEQRQKQMIIDGFNKNYLHKYRNVHS